MLAKICYDRIFWARVVLSKTKGFLAFPGANKFILYQIPVHDAWIKYIKEYRRSKPAKERFYLIDAIVSEQMAWTNKHLYDNK